ncbi:hypothetical protein F3J28_20930 [Enterobacter sp. Ap-1006]|uniref:hypothetical protein n=1 Tax=Enterobacter sp. Ap-1006 TaxID=2608345 RepID=UPI001421B255|nr:hypothetical protein [Enterobacter sp. Ap-1006]NIF50228.1 hypothetical protein [Enterobacter sp. Ap-1006]
MTSEEYAKKISERLNDNVSDYENILNNAERVLNDSNISQMNKDIFWITLSNIFNSDQQISENVSNKNLNREVLAARQAIANRIISLKK